MSKQHTPGPWHVDRGQEVYALGSNERRLIAECHAGHREERGANARLIAAAPDLLEAFADPDQEHPEEYALHVLDLAAVLLRRCAGEVGLGTALNLECFRSKAQAAIAKAKGE